jgi:hypothetical protein
MVREQTGFWIFGVIGLQVVLQITVTLSLFPHYTILCYTHTSVLSILQSTLSVSWQRILKQEL